MTTPSSAAFAACVRRGGEDAEHFEAQRDATLLESMEAAGISWPSSCRNGTCRSCITQLDRGHAYYRIAWPGVSESEQAEGYVLPCVAYPVGPLALRDPFE